MSGHFCDKCGLWHGAYEGQCIAELPCDHTWSVQVVNGEPVIVFCPHCGEKRTVNG